MGVSWKWGGGGHNEKVRETESQSGMESPHTLEAYDVCLFLPQTRSMFPFEMVESTAVFKSLGTSETNDPSQTVLTGSAWEPKESCDWCRITAIPPLFPSITAQWNSWGTIRLSYDAVYIRRWGKAPPEVLHGCFWIIIQASWAGVVLEGTTKLSAKRQLVMFGEAGSLCLLLCQANIVISSFQLL